MATSKKRTVLKVFGYVTFTVMSLLVCFFLTFPYDALKDRIRLEADAAGYFLKIGSIGPGFFTVKLKDVEVSKKADTDPPPESLKIDAVSVGASLFPPGIKVHIDAFDGDIVARVSGITNNRYRLDADGLDLSKGNIKGFSGIAFSGTVNATVDVTIPRTSVDPKIPAEPDLSAASGSVNINTNALTINGGTANITIPQFGAEPTPVDLPKIGIGELIGKIKVDKGVVTFDEFKSKSADFESKILGTIKLAKRFEYSEANLDIKLKPEPEFQKNLGMIGSAFSMLGPDAQDPNWRAGKLTGTLGRPQFR
jgi:type II secretion system protein N